MKLPPYQEMPPEIRMRLRERVLPSLSTHPGPRVPYMVAAATVVVACVAAALLMSPARNAAPPAGQPTTTSTDMSAEQRMADKCDVRPGDGWQAGPYVRIDNGDGAQLGIKPDGGIGLCLISNGHPTPFGWGRMTTQQLTTVGQTFQAGHAPDLVFGKVGPGVAWILEDGFVPPLVNGYFMIQDGSNDKINFTTFDAQHRILEQKSMILN